MIAEVLAIIDQYDLEKEVFLSVLLGAKDITPELLAELGAEYNVEIKAEVNED